VRRQGAVKSRQTHIALRDFGLYTPPLQLDETIQDWYILRMADSKENQAGVDRVAFRLGSLEEASEYANVFGEAKELSPSGPVFGGVADPSLVQRLEGRSVIASAPYDSTK
jgi:hypothetical protein